MNNRPFYTLLVGFKKTGIDDVVARYGSDYCVPYEQDLGFPHMDNVVKVVFSEKIQEDTPLLTLLLFSGIDRMSVIWYFEKSEKRYTWLDIKFGNLKLDKTVLKFYSNHRPYLDQQSFVAITESREFKSY